MILCRLRTILSLFLLALACVSQASAGRVTEVRVSEKEDAVRLVVETTSSISYRFRDALAAEGQFSIQLSGVTAIPSVAKRHGAIDSFSRVELESNASQRVAYIHIHSDRVSVPQVQRLSNPYRIVFDFPLKSKRAVAPSTSNSVSRPRPTSSTARTIVIDPGHGGKHRGGYGYTRKPYKNKTPVTLPSRFQKDYGYSRGYRLDEADVTLPIALKLEQYLLEDGRFAPALTLRSDTYLSLPDRTRKAEQYNGDLFVSIHFNSIPASKPKTPRGLEFFTWSAREDDSVASRYLRSLDNDEGLSADLGRASSEAKNVLNEMMLDALEEQAFASERLALSFEGAFLQDSYFKKHYRGRKKGRFRVLQIYNMPSILVEVAFICNPYEAELSKDAAFQKRTAYLLYRGIVSYFQKHDPDFAASSSGRAVAAK